MSERSDIPNEIRYDLRARRPQFTKWIAGFLILVEAITVVRFASRGASPVHYVIPAFLVAVFCVCSTRRFNTVVVDRRGIRFPSRRFMPWAQVEAVHRNKYSDLVSLRIVGGRDRSTGLPAEYAKRVAEIGNVPLT